MKRRTAEVEASASALKREMAAQHDALTAELREAQRTREAADYDRTRAVDQVTNGSPYAIHHDGSLYIAAYPAGGPSCWHGRAVASAWY